MNLTTVKQYLTGSIKSWTMHFNVWVTVLVTVLPTLQEQLPQLQGVLPANLYQIAFTIVVAGNLLLRVRTTEGLTSK